MKQPFALLAATLILAAPAVAGFKKGEAGSMTGGQIRSILKSGSATFKDADSGRTFKFINYIGGSVEYCVSTDTQTFDFGQETLGTYTCWREVAGCPIFDQDGNYLPDAHSNLILKSGWIEPYFSVVEVTAAADSAADGKGGTEEKKSS